MNGAKAGRIKMKVKEEENGAEEITEETYATSALLSVPEASKYLGVSRKKIYELIEWGELKAVKLGHSIQIERDSLDAFKASGKLT
jgi:excisionase family DNA binding protein